jgi:predicted transcriptional regulator
VARRKSPLLTEAELRLMDVLWAQGSGTVADVVDSLKSDPPLAYSTVLTTLRILEDKGYVQHTKEGRAFIYKPVVGREEATRNVVKRVLSQFFGNSPELLVMNLVKSDELSKRELERLIHKIEEGE